MKQLTVPIAILIAGILIAVSLYIVRHNEAAKVPEGDISLLRPVSPDDHLLGSPTADITIITYSDIDCAYCKQFQKTMQQVMSEYGASGNVAWVYRHFPLVHLHPNAELHAVAAECVSTLSSNSQAFWQFIDALHARSSIQSFNPEQYSLLLPAFSVTEEAFSECLGEGVVAERVRVDMQNAIAIGIKGTPYNVILIEGKEPITISGALPYESVKKIIDETLKEIGS